MNHFYRGGIELKCWMYIWTRSIMVSTVLCYGLNDGLWSNRVREYINYIYTVQILYSPIHSQELRRSYDSFVRRTFYIIKLTDGDVRLRSRSNRKPFMGWYGMSGINLSVPAAAHSTQSDDITTNASLQPDIFKKNFHAPRSHFSILGGSSESNPFQKCTHT